MTDENLKPCPFCGKNGQILMEGDHHGEFFALGCNPGRSGLMDECPAATLFYTTPIEEKTSAVHAWNTRAQEPTGDAVEAAKKLFDLPWSNYSTIRGSFPESVKIIEAALQTPAAGMIDPTKQTPEPTDALVEFMGGNAIPSESVDVEAIMRRYDTGLLGGSHLQDADWWQDYIRAELDRAHDFYQAEYDAAQGLLTGKIPSGYALVPIEPTDEMRTAFRDGDTYNGFAEGWKDAIAAAPSTNKEETK